MKRIFLMFLMSACLIGCSVDRDSLDLLEDPVQEFNAAINVEGCDPEIHDFGNAGTIEVVNDDEFLYVTFVAAEGYSLTKASLHLASSLSGFPTVGQGNLPGGQLEYQESFNPNQRDYTFTFGLDEIEECNLIAAYGSFSNGTEAGSFWAGNINVDKGNWSYFEYCEQTCAISSCEGLAGPDNSITLTVAQVQAKYNSISTLRNLFSDVLVGDGVSINGTYNPTITELGLSFAEAENKVGTYSTTYTVTENGCSDEAVLSIIVVE